MSGESKPVQRSAFIVDNDPSVLDALSARLRTEGFVVHALNSAAELLAMELPRQRACLILDIRMPHMDGLELLRTLRARGVSLPVIVMSAYGDPVNVVQAMNEGAIDFLEKPFEIERLIQRVGEATEDAPVQGVLTRMTKRLTPDEAGSLFKEIMPKLILAILAEVDQTANVEAITRMADHFGRVDVQERIRKFEHVRDGILAELVTSFELEKLKASVTRESLLKAIETSGALHRLRVLESCLIHSVVA